MTSTHGHHGRNTTFTMVSWSWLEDIIANLPRGSQDCPGFQKQNSDPSTRASSSKMASSEMAWSTRITADETKESNPVLIRESGLRLKSRSVYQKLYPKVRRPKIVASNSLRIALPVGQLSCRQPSIYEGNAGVDELVHGVSAGCAVSFGC